jgi:hypothetical protein
LCIVPVADLLGPDDGQPMSLPGAAPD